MNFRNFSYVVVGNNGGGNNSNPSRIQKSKVQKTIVIDNSVVDYSVQQARLPDTKKKNDDHAEFVSLIKRSIDNLKYINFDDSFNRHTQTSQNCFSAYGNESDKKDLEQVSVTQHVQRFQSFDEIFKFTE